MNITKMNHTYIKTAAWAEHYDCSGTFELRSNEELDPVQIEELLELWIVQTFRNQRHATGNTIQTTTAVTISGDVTRDLEHIEMYSIEEAHGKEATEAGKCECCKDTLLEVEKTHCLKCQTMLNSIHSWLENSHVKEWLEKKLSTLK